MSEILKSWFTDKQGAQAMIMRDLLIDIFGRRTSDLTFRGGTALSFFYGTDRFSEDIDFLSNSIDSYLTVDEAIESFGRRYNHVIINDWESEIDRSGRFRRYHLVFKYAVGENIEIRIDCSAGICHLEPLKKELSNDYYSAVAHVMRPEEILAEKVMAIYARHKARDLYDLHHLAVKMRTGISRSLIFDKFGENPELKGIKYSFASFKTRVVDLKRYWNELNGIVNDFGSSNFDRIRDELLETFKTV